VDGCTGTNTARGWCNVHYRRWQRTGDPLKVAWERGDPVANFRPRCAGASPEKAPRKADRSTYQREYYERTQKKT